jgi:hypothetical protein
MSKNVLHALLAVEPDLVQGAQNLVAETISTFSKKGDHFDGLQKVYKPFSDDASTEQIPPEVKEVVTTVKEKIDFTKEFVIKALDATLSKEETNSSGGAVAKLEIEGKDFGTFSATSFLALERNLLRLREMYKAIPTLDPTTKWDTETQSGRNLYVSPQEVRFRSVRQQKPITLAPATDKHPAQVQIFQEDVQVGKYETVYFSGKISVKEKSEYLGRLDNLILAVKRAKEEANRAEVKQVHVGENIFKYIQGEK